MLDVRRMSEAERRRRALARALARGGATSVVRVRFGLYRIGSNSRPGRFRTVSVDAGGRYHCDCPAGLLGRPCWHTAATYIAKLEHAGRIRVVRPS